MGDYIRYVTVLRAIEDAGMLGSENLDDDAVDELSDQLKELLWEKNPEVIVNALSNLLAFVMHDDPKSLAAFIGFLMMVLEGRVERID